MNSQSHSLPDTRRKTHTKSTGTAPPSFILEDLSVDIQIGKQKKKVVDSLTLQLHPGKTCALVGESGCGKSVSALAMMNQLPSPPFSKPTGSMRIQGEYHPLQSCKSHPSMAMIFQNPMTTLNPLLTVGQHLIQSALVHRTRHLEEARLLAISSLKDVHMLDAASRIDDYPHQLSGGMRQRVLIALALISQPTVLIGDEPTTALDLTVQKGVMELIEEIKRERKLAVLLISHNISLVGRYADDVCVMYLSQQVESADKKTILTAPCHPYTRGLLASEPKIDNFDKKPLQAIPGVVPSLDAKPSGCYFHPRCQYAQKQCKEGNIELAPVQEKPQEAHATCGSPHLVRCLRAKEINR